MSEIARHLPLSQREARDESSVSSNWSPVIGGSLIVVADLLATLSPEDWERESLRSGWRVRDVAGHLVWRTRGGALTRALDGARAVIRQGAPPNRIADWLSRRAAETEPDRLIEALREIADARLAVRGRHRIDELTEVIVHGYDIAGALSAPLAFSPIATGAVALARALVAPMPIRAIIRHRTFVASDAGWRVGRGPELAASAQSIVMFLFGRSERVPGSSPDERSPSS